MATDYRSLSTDELLAALESAGRKPDLDLIRTCLERREELTPGLLRMLAEGVDETWPDDDPRLFREIHAGLLLIAYREPAALPIFEGILRDEQREDLLEWFDNVLPAYGPPLIPIAKRVLEDRRGPWYGRAISTSLLVAVALHHPEERERALGILRAQLPPLREDGTLPPGLREQRDEAWAWVASALGDLRDIVSRPQVEALFEQGLIDEMIIDLPYYQSLLQPGAPAPREAHIYDDILQYYQNQHETEARRAAVCARYAFRQEMQPEPALPSWPTAAAEPAVLARGAPRVGRNDPCPCGSGRKYKHCCGRRGGVGA